MSASAAPPDVVAASILAAPNDLDLAIAHDPELTHPAQWVHDPEDRTSANIETCPPSVPGVARMRSVVKFGPRTRRT